MNIVAEVSILPYAAYRVSVTHLGSGRAPETETRGLPPGSRVTRIFKDGRPPWTYPGAYRDLLLIKGSGGYESEITVRSFNSGGYHQQQWRYRDGPGVPKVLFIRCDLTSQNKVNFGYSRPFLIPPRDHPFRSMPKEGWRALPIVNARGHGWEEPLVVKEAKRLSINGPRYEMRSVANDFVCRTPEAADELAVFLKLMLR